MAQGAIPTTKNNKVAVNSSDSNPSYLENKITSSDGSVSIVTGSCNCELDLTVNGSGGFTEKWIKATLSYEDFDVANTTIDITPSEFSGLGAGLFFSGYKIKHSESFTGSAASVASMQILFLGAGNSNSLDVLSAVTDTNYTAGTMPTANGASHTGTNDIIVRLFLFGDDGENLTAGEAEIWLKTAYLI